MEIGENEYFVGDLADKNTLEKFVHRIFVKVQV